MRIYNAQCHETLAQILAVPRRRRFEVLRFLASTDDTIDGTRLLTNVCDHQHGVRVLTFFSASMPRYVMANWDFKPGSIKRIGECLPKLEALYIEGNPRARKIKPTELNNVLRKCPQLRVLGLAMMRFSVHDAFQLEKPLELRTLCLSHCDVNSEHCEIFAVLCPKLKELDLGMTLVDDSGVEALKHLPLTKLELYRYYIVSSGVYIR